MKLKKSLKVIVLHLIVIFFCIQWTHWYKFQSHWYYLLRYLFFDSKEKLEIFWLLGDCNFLLCSLNASFTSLKFIEIIRFWLVSILTGILTHGVRHVQKGFHVAWMAVFLQQLQSWWCACIYFTWKSEEPLERMTCCNLACRIKSSDGRG